MSRISFKFLTGLAMENALDQVYLPHRLTNVGQDRWVKLNVHWPKGLKENERRPGILFGHGGGYGSAFSACSCEEVSQRSRSHRCVGIFRRRLAFFECDLYRCR